jgi:hypothetical protein
MRRTVRTLVPIVCPDDVATLGLVDEVVDYFELSMRSLPPYLRAGFVAGLVSFEAGTIALPSSLGRPFSLLPDAKARAYFERWWTSPIGAIRQFAKGLKAFLVMGYYENPLVKQRMEYHPDRWIAEAAKRRLATYADEIRAHERANTAPDPLVAPESLFRKAKGHVDKAS